MRAHDSEPVWATVGPVPMAEDTPRGDTIPNPVAVIRNPLVTGDEGFWVALEYLAPRLGIHMKRDDEAATQPARRLPVARAPMGPPAVPPLVRRG